MSNFELEYPDIFKTNGMYSKDKVPVFVPAQIFRLDSLNKIVNENPDIDLYKVFSDLSSYFQKVTGYQWGNCHYYLQNMSSTLFKFMFTKDKITVWDISDFTVYVGRFDRNKIADAMFNYDKGIIVCSKCNVTMDLKENKSHRYFAGIYCTKCWEGGMKQIEAKQSYN